MGKVFLSCDWGTSSFRLRLVDIDGHIIQQVNSAEGIAATYQQWVAAGSNENERLSFYLEVIKKYSSTLLLKAGFAANENIALIISGMASSSIGMKELAYTNMPLHLNGKDLSVQKFEKTSQFPHEVLLISGVRTENDVMRGEETQLIGSATALAGTRQLFIFPGTHSKHVLVEDDTAISFETFMTGEFFEFLSSKSVLANSVAAGGDINDKENNAAFTKGIEKSKLSSVLHNSFLVRTNQLFNKYSTTANYFYLSGLLIGEELKLLNQTAFDQITIVGEKKLQENYKLALSILDINANIIMADVTEATIKGQLAVYKKFYL